MTCQQLGGPCKHELRGNTADEIIKAQDQHLKHVVANGDNTHIVALQAMKGRWKRPLGAMRWYKQTKRDFAVTTRCLKAQAPNADERRDISAR